MVVFAICHCLTLEHFSHRPLYTYLITAIRFYVCPNLTYNCYVIAPSIICISPRPCVITYFKQYVIQCNNNLSLPSQLHFFLSLLYPINCWLLLHMLYIVFQPLYDHYISAILYHTFYHCLSLKHFCNCCFTDLPFNFFTHHILHKKKFEDIKGVIIIRNSRKDR